MPPDTLRRWVTQQLAERLVRESVAALGPDAEVLPIKGALLARTVYDSPDQRPLADVDLVLARPSLREGIHRLVRAGFTVQHWSGDLHFQLATPRVPGLSLDLHGRPLPRGYGALDAAYLAVGSREDTALFGARIRVADDRRLLVCLLAAIVRDLFDLAPAHAAEDVARLVERSAYAPSDFARAAREARFARGAWAALGWVLDRRASPALQALHHALTPSPAGRALALGIARQLRGMAARRPLPVAAWALAPMLSDSPRDALAGVGAFALGLPLGALNAPLPHDLVAW